MGRPRLHVPRVPSAQSRPHLTQAAQQESPPNDHADHGNDGVRRQAAGDLSEARWVAARLGGAIGTVTQTVPGGYPAYARVCHPVEDETGSLVTWTEVAEVTGRRPHPLMQWHALIGSSNAVNPRSADWAGKQPDPRKPRTGGAGAAVRCAELAHGNSGGSSKVPSAGPHRPAEASPAGAPHARIPK